MKDLRQFIKRCEQMGELKVIEGANWDLEIGALSFEIAAGLKPPALLFDKIEGYKAGFRVLTIPATTDKRVALVLGLPIEASQLEVVRLLREKLNEPLQLMPPVEVKEAPILENVCTGDEVNLFKFPTPQWTASDGGRYIGTGDNVIVRDPDEGWVNVSVHRIQIHDKSTVTIFVDLGRHLGIIREKYWKGGQNCPVAVTCGGNPSLVSISGMRVPWGVSEYDYAGWWMKEPVEVIKGPTTGLPIPAHAEIAFEGEIVPPEVETKIEGPFVEGFGHYAPARPEAVCKVKTILHRNDPIILGVMGYLGPGVPTGMSAPIISAQVWSELDRIVPGVRGVWILGEFGIERCMVISLKQQYPGHAKQAALAALGYNPMNRKYIIVVDDDVDPSNIREVLFATGNRAAPEAFDIIRGIQVTQLDPLAANPEKRRINELTGSTAIILACKPFNWIDEFPPSIRIEPALQEKVRKKWPELFQ